jgi:hypothetical protein
MTRTWFAIGFLAASQGCGASDSGADLAVRDAPACSDCDATEFCAEFSPDEPDQESLFQCVSVPHQCVRTPTCACMDELDLGATPFVGCFGDECTDGEALHAVCPGG